MWNEELILFFIENYKDEEILWDAKNPFYKDKAKVNDAWCRLSNVFNLPISELKKKRDNLMSVYRRNKLSIEKSVLSGSNDVYQPSWFAYSALDGFLRDNRTTGTRLSSSGENVTVLIYTMYLHA